MSVWHVCWDIYCKCQQVKSRAKSSLVNTARIDSTHVTYMLMLSCCLPSSAIGLQPVIICEIKKKTRMFSTKLNCLHNTSISDKFHELINFPLSSEWDLVNVIMIYLFVCVSQIRALKIRAIWTLRQSCLDTARDFILMFTTHWHKALSEFQGIAF